jgi:hypothetical protein
MELSEVGNGKLWFLRLVEELQRRDRRAPPRSSAPPRPPKPGAPRGRGSAVGAGGRRGVPAARGETQQPRPRAAGGLHGRGLARALRWEPLVNGRVDLYFGLENAGRGAGAGPLDRPVTLPPGP